MDDYIIACELSHLNGHYDALVNRLTALGAQPKLQTVWTLEANGQTADTLQRDLSRLIHPQDRLFIARLHK